MEYETKRESEMDAGIDMKLKLPNQAAFGVWAGQLWADKWRFMMVLIFNMVNDLGRQLTDVGAFTQMQGGEFKTVDGIDSYLFIINPVPTTTRDAMFNDPVYGLNNLDNYGKWGSIVPGADPIKRKLLQWELKSYFGLTDA